MQLLDYVIKLSVDYGAHVVYLALLIIVYAQARADRKRLDGLYLELLDRYHTQLHALTEVIEDLSDELRSKRD